MTLQKSDAGGNNMKDCKIVCEGKEVGTITMSEDGISIKCTKEGKDFCKKFKGCC